MHIILLRSGSMVNQAFDIGHIMYLINSLYCQFTGTFSRPGFPQGAKKNCPGKRASQVSGR